MKKVMVSQPRYLPCVGYLNRIAKADVFVILDTVQRNGRVYENRNKIKDRNGGDRWLTIPIESSSRAIIKDTIIFGDTWRTEHFSKMQEHIADDIALMYYKWYLDKMGSLYYRESLVEGLLFLKEIFDIKTEFVLASTLSNTINGGIDELLYLTKKVGGTEYISGPSCIDYGLTEEYAKKHGISLNVSYNESYVLWLEAIALFNFTKFTP